MLKSTIIVFIIYSLVVVYFCTITSTFQQPDIFVEDDNNNGHKNCSKSDSIFPSNALLYIIQQTVKCTHRLAHSLSRLPPPPYWSQPGNRLVAPGEDAVRLHGLIISSDVLFASDGDVTSVLRSPNMQ